MLDFEPQLLRTANWHKQCVDVKTAAFDRDSSRLLPTAGGSMGLHGVVS